MVSVGIIGLGAYVPPNEMSNEDWMEYVDTSDEWITTKTGMKKRRIASSDMCTSDLAVEACKQALEDANLKPKDIDLLILATSSPDVPLSSTAGIIQDKLGCVECAAFDINAVCAGWIHALDIGSRFAGTSGYQNVLVVGSEIYSRILNWKDRATCVLFGDGAGAVVLSEVGNGKGILGSWLMSDGSGSSVIEIPAGGVRTPFNSEDFEEGKQYFHMDGRAVWDFAIEAFPQAVRNALSKVGKDISDVDLIIPHQANINIIKAGMEKLNLGMDKTFTNLHKYGNTAGASVPIAMREAMDEGLIKEGTLVVTAAFGGGLAWGANVIQF
ncbi:ketoacyl-ACP synthase III [Euryarchaeota archaeon]|nr:ketoacyl-ACP synthase III [Candidatus Thalassarchaeum sp.]MDB3855372.1 ketoacyl-ACP synthase III [Euryarchaeota archaeon]MDB4865613.1 ketoacyl-ACP synthase III [Euryarchaeota archaeon]MDC3282070.1 ketoacyl-ACP synthase III [Euryarchaeota archaeon]